MGALTMPYSAGKNENLSKLSSGDQIQADLVATGRKTYLEGIKITKTSGKK